MAGENLHAVLCGWLWLGFGRLGVHTKHGEYSGCRGAAQPRLLWKSTPPPHQCRLCAGIAKPGGWHRIGPGHRSTRPGCCRNTGTGKWDQRIRCEFVGADNNIRLHRARISMTWRTKSSQVRPTTSPCPCSRLSVRAYMANCGRCPKATRWFASSMSISLSSKGSCMYL